MCDWTVSYYWGGYIVKLKNNRYIEIGSGIYKPPRIGNNVRIGSHVCIIGNTTIMDNCHIGAGAIIANSIIGEGCKIGPGVVISRCKIGKYCKIRAGVSLFGKEIPDYCIVEPAECRIIMKKEDESSVDKNNDKEVIKYENSCD